MSQLSHHEIVVLLVSLGVLLAAARALGEVARRLGQPAVIGEIAAGILLGPTVLQAALPGLGEWLFPREGPLPQVMHGITTIAITLFLLVAGMEVDLSTIWRRRVAALSVGVGGMVVPFAVALVPALLAPRLMGWDEGSSVRVFALFLATALSISALPVVAKMLIDLQLFRTDLGMTIIAAAVFNDLAGWMVFAIVLALMGHAASSGLELWHTITLTLVFVAFMLVAGRWLIDRSLPWVQAHTSFPGGVLGFALVITIACAAFTEWIGVHAIFGAFICGVALGDSRHLRPRTREIIEQFVSFIFAPLFFASIGLRVDFAANFDLGLVLVVLALATVGKLAGCVISARFAGFRSREAWAIGFGMNARGAMEIILGLLALEAGLINERLFVALVIMALLTSITSGMLVQWSLGKPKPVRFWAFASSKSFVPNLEATNSTEAIRALAGAAADANPALDADAVAEAALARERLMGSGIGGGIAVPHARLSTIDTPTVAIGRVPGGVDFDAPDEQPARLVILLITPASQPEYQLRLLASVAQTAQSPETVERLVEAESWTEFLAALNTDATPAQEHG